MPPFSSQDRSGRASGAKRLSLSSKSCQVLPMLPSMPDRTCDTARLLEAHHTLWTARLLLGELALAHTHLEQGLALYDAKQHRAGRHLWAWACVAGAWRP